KSNPKLPSLASIRDFNFLPTRKSFSALGQCQSSEAKFQFTMCSGLFHKSHTFSMGTSTVAFTVIIVFMSSVFVRYNLRHICDFKDKKVFFYLICVKTSNQRAYCDNFVNFRF